MRIPKPGAHCAQIEPEQAPADDLREALLRLCQEVEALRDSQTLLEARVTSLEEELSAYNETVAPLSELN
jgi:predicted  nucleic acid-binding Zn-ribbon protein